MRRFFLFLLPIMICLACAPRPVFRMRPVEKNTTFNQGVEYVHRQKYGVEMTISYYQHVGNKFAMDVEIVNNTDSVLRVGPGQFSYDAYGGYIGKMPSDSTAIMASCKAINPEHELLKKDIAISRSIANQKTSDLIYGIGETASIASAFVNDNKQARDENEDDSQNYYLQHEVNRQERRAQRSELRDRRNVWQIDTIRKTDVFPGEYIRGYVFFTNQPNARGYIFHYHYGGADFSVFFKQKKISVRYNN